MFAFTYAIVFIKQSFKMFKIFPDDDDDDDVINTLIELELNFTWLR